MHYEIYRKKIPKNKKILMANINHGKIIIDKYRWLEDFNDNKVQGWVAEQNNVARKYLDALPRGGHIIQKRMKMLNQYYWFIPINGG